MSGPKPQLSAVRPLAIDVVSIQSQVVYGRVGNSVAVPALEEAGLTVAAVPTVLLSNTPHYASVHGGAIPDDWFAGFLDDLLARGALQQARAIIVGFLGSPGQATKLAEWLETALRLRPELQVIVDTVIGDHDYGVYVAPGVVETICGRLAPLAGGITLNGFELEVVSGQPTRDLEGVIAAARNLIKGRTQWVVVKSAAPAAWERDAMLVVSVTSRDATIFQHDRLPRAPKGTGDLFTALLTAKLLAGMSLAEAAAGACHQVLARVRKTAELSCEELVLSLPAS